MASCGPGVRLDFRGHLGRDIEVDDLQAQVAATGAELAPGTIVLLWTGADAFIDDDDRYFQCQVGQSVAGLNWLLDHGIKLIGIDAYAVRQVGSAPVAMVPENHFTASPGAQAGDAR